MPENAIVNTGTTVQWFSGDVGHERTIDVKDTDGSTSIFNTSEIVDSRASNLSHLVSQVCLTMKQKVTPV